MKLVRIAKGRWDVVAIADREGRSQVLDFLDGSGPAHGAARGFLSVCLQVYVPLEGPPTCNRQLCKPLGDGIFELRRSEGWQPRILFFDDERRRIVCTNAVSEAEVTSSAEILLARGLRQQYYETKSRQEVQVVNEIYPELLTSR